MHTFQLGFSSRTFHCPLIVSSPHLQLTAVVERHNNKSKEVYPWVTVAKSTDELFAMDNVDMVVITTPNDSHFALAKEAMEKGKHGKKLYIGKVLRRKCLIVGCDI